MCCFNDSGAFSIEEVEDIDNQISTILENILRNLRALR